MTETKGWGSRLSATITLIVILILGKIIIFLSERLASENVGRGGALCVCFFFSARTYDSACSDDRCDDASSSRSEVTANACVSRHTL